MCSFVLFSFYKSLLPVDISVCLPYTFLFPFLRLYFLPTIRCCITVLYGPSNNLLSHSSGLPVCLEHTRIPTHHLCSCRLQLPKHFEVIVCTRAVAVILYVAWRTWPHHTNWGVDSDVSSHAAIQVSALMEKDGHVLLYWLLLLIT